MTESITISGETFQVSKPYAEGHQLTANEASALNQTRIENLRNNFAAKVKDAKAAGAFDLPTFQAQFTALDSAYVFGVRSAGGGGGPRLDPVEAEAMNIAREKVRAAIVKKGHKLSDVSAATITELAKKAVEANPSIRELAQARVTAAQNLADVDVGDLNESEGGAPVATAKTKAAKPEASA